MSNVNIKIFLIRGILIWKPRVDIILRILISEFQTCFLNALFRQINQSYMKLSISICYTEFFGTLKKYLFRNNSSCVQQEWNSVWKFYFIFRYIISVQIKFFKIHLVIMSKMKNLIIETYIVLLNKFLLWKIKEGKHVIKKLLWKCSFIFIIKSSISVF